MSRLDMTGQEVKKFSLMRAITACVQKDWSKAGFELECSRAVAKNMNKIQEPTKFFVPFEVLERPIERQGQRDLSVASGGGAYLVATDNIGFIELLRHRSVLFRMGARRLSGLTGNVTVPRMSAGATAYWLTSETSEITESQQTILQMALSPKTVGAYTEISRQLMLQSTPAAEGIVSDDLAQVVAIAADLAGLTGTGLNGQPHGIEGTTLVGSVSGTGMTYAASIEMQTDVAAYDVIPIRPGFVTNPAAAGVLMSEMKVSNTFSPVWEGNIWEGTVNGLPALTSNQITSGGIFGDWQELVVAEWGVLEVEVNPYANFKAGIVGVRAMYSMDIGIRRPFAFTVISAIS
jgi:HK97 family phage major capsid protein